MLIRLDKKHGQDPTGVPMRTMNRPGTAEELMGTPEMKTKGTALSCKAVEAAKRLLPLPPSLPAAAARSIPSSGHPPRARQPGRGTAHSYLLITKWKEKPTRMTQPQSPPQPAALHPPLRPEGSVPQALPTVPHRRPASPPPTIADDATTSKRDAAAPASLSPAPATAGTSPRWAGRCPGPAAAAHTGEDRRGGDGMRWNGTEGRDRK